MQTEYQDFIRQYVMKIIMGMIGRRADFEVREYAMGHYENTKKITFEDLQAVDKAIDDYNNPPMVEEMPVDPMMGV